MEWSPEKAAEQPLVSVVVPTFNQAQTLPEALDSVLFQDYPNIEVIVCNHGSTDGTDRIMRDYLRGIEQDEVSYLDRMDDSDGEERLIRSCGKRYPAGRSVVVLESDENIGATRSYNEGFTRATGAYCTYLVADDAFLPTALSEMVQVLETGEADFVYADMFVVDNGGRILQRLEKPEYTFRTCLADWFHLGACKLYRRSLHEKVGYYDPGYRNANDYDMFFRFALAGCRFKHVPRVLYRVRKHDPDNPAEPAAWRNRGYENLMRESIRCARRARRFLREIRRDEHD
ncbi:MAG: glycosyltransferase [Deltaproteobacteria bacterium]|nr:glycosyltransferase [Deltaproteobacteria bacterium]